MIAQRALFLNNKGHIVNLDGTRDIKIGVPTVNNNLYVVVWHRNHLGVMTSNPVSFDSAPYSYDFTSGESQAYGGAAGYNEISPGIWGMVSGDANADGSVDTNDGIDSWYPYVGLSGYLNADVNLDGQVDNQDKNEFWLPNFGKAASMP